MTGRWAPKRSPVPGALGTVVSVSDTQAKGGVGNSFEVSVAAVQLTAVLCGSSSALMGDGVTLTSVRHQNPDFKVDDLTLTGVRVRGGECITMAAGIRHKPSITRSDTKFVKLLGTFLTDLVEHRDACRNDMHRFGLVVSSNKAEGARELSRLTEAARASSSPEQMNLCNDPLRVRYRYLEAAVDSAVDLWIPDTVQVDVGASGSAERTLLIWELLRSLRVGVVQVLDEMAEARTAAINEIRNVALDPTDAEDLWHHLVSMALRGNPNGAAFDRATLLRIFSGRLKPELNDRSDVRDVYSRALETHRVVLALQAQNDVFARVAPAYVSSRVLQVLREWDDRNSWQSEVRTAIEAVTGACKRAGLKDAMYSGLNTVNRARSTNSATLARLRAVDGDVAGLATRFEVRRRERKVNGLRMQQSARDALTWLQDQADSPTYASTINLAGSLGSGRSRALREFMAGLPAGRGLALFPEPFGAEDLAQSVLRAAAAVLGTRFTSLDALAAWMSRHSRDSRLYIVVDDLDHHGPEVTASVSFVVDETSQFDNLRWMFAADSHRLDLVTTRKGSEVWRMNGYTGSETLSSAGDGWIDLDVWNRADQTGLKILAAAIADGGRRNAPSKVSTQDAPDVEAIADNPEKFPHEVAHLASPLQALVRLRANHGPVPLTDVNHPQFARMYWDAIAQNAAELRVDVDRLEVFLRGLTVALVEQREVLSLTGNWAAYHQEALWLSSIGLATTYYAPDKNPANPAVRVVEPRLDAMWAERIDTEIASRPVATPASPGMSASKRPRVETQPKVSRKKRRQAHKAATPADRPRGRAAQQARGSSTAQETKRPSRTSIRDLWPLLADWIARALHGNQLSDSVLQMAIMRIASDPLGQTGGDGDSKKRAPTPAGDSTIARSWAQDREFLQPAA